MPFQRSNLHPKQIDQGKRHAAQHIVWKNQQKLQQKHGQPH